MRGFIAQFKAEGIRIIRSPFFLLFSVLMPLVFYILFTYLNGADTNVGGTAWAGYSLMSMTAFSLIGTAAGQFGIRISYERKEGLHRLLRLTPLSNRAWVGAKIVSHMLVHLLIILIMFTVALLAFRVELPIDRWLLSGGWLLVGSLPFLGLGILVGMIKNPDVATAVSNLVYMGISVAGGLWMPLEVFPEWLQAIGRWLPSHVYANGAWNLIAGTSVQLYDMVALFLYGIVFVGLTIMIMNRREAS